ncbi:MAG TPA: hypothetical protein VGF44_06215 [Terriglobales bacterium]|jgi:hypothetical protein
MKTAFFAICFLFATSAFAQNSLGAGHLSNQPTVYEFDSHPEKAAYRAMGTEESLLNTNSPFTAAQGERPLWEVAPKIEVVPLGDIARAYKKDHAAVPKSTMVWENF